MRLFCFQTRCYKGFLAHNTFETSRYRTQNIPGIIIAGIPNKTFSHGTWRKRYATYYGGVQPVQRTIRFQWLGATNRVNPNITDVPTCPSGRPPARLAGSTKIIFPPNSPDRE